MRQFRPLLLATCAAATSPAFASEGLDYSYLDLDLISIDFGPSGDGFSLAGSRAVTDSLFLVGQYQLVDFGLGANVELSELRLGAGLHRPINDSVDMFAVVNWERTAFSSSFGDASDNGFGVAGGLRGRLTGALELQGQLRHVDYGDGANDTLLGVGAVYALSERFALHGAYESGDADTVSFGVRMQF